MLQRISIQQLMSLHLYMEDMVEKLAVGVEMNER